MLVEARKPPWDGGFVWKKDKQKNPWIGVACESEGTYDLTHKIRERGYKDTWIWSSNMAQSLYRKIGYVDADFGLWQYNWHKGSANSRT